MFIGYGFPKVFNAGNGREEDWLYVTQDLYYIIAVSRSAVQVWSAGLHRVKLSQVLRIEEDIMEEGGNLSAFWCPAKCTLAVLTSQHVLHIYSLYAWKDGLAPASSNLLLRDVPKVDIYLRSTIRLELGSRATVVSGDSRLILLGCADGSVAALNWSGKVREISPILVSSSSLPYSLSHSNSWAGSMHATHIPSTQPSMQASQDFSAPRDSQLVPLNPLLSATDVDMDHIQPQSYQALSLTMNLPSRASSSALPVSFPPVTDMHFCERSRALSLVLADGSAALCSGASETHPLAGLALSHWLVCPPVRHATCARIGWLAQMVAVGCSNGEVALYRLHRSSTLSSLDPSSAPSTDEGEAPVRVLTLDPWGHKLSQTGGVAQVEWSPDGRAIAVGYQRHGLSVWSPSGCRLMCSLRQPRGGDKSALGGMNLMSMPSLGRRSTLDSDTASFFASAPAGISSTSVEGSEDALHRHLEVPVSCLSWGVLGYQLLIAESGRQHLVELHFARSLSHHHRVAHAGVMTDTGEMPGEELHVMQAHDRLLVIAEGLNAVSASSFATPMATPSSDSTAHHIPSSSQYQGSPAGSGMPNQQQGADLTVSHIPVPLSYIGPNWPLLHTSVSTNGLHIAVAGLRGLALYSRAANKWRLFGDVSQERKIWCQALSWMQKDIIVCCSISGDGSAKAIPHAMMGHPGVGGSSFAGNASSTVSASSAFLAGERVQGGPCELILFPRYHLDLTSVLVRYPVPQVPLAMDCVGSHILLASQPLEIALFEVSITGKLSPSSSPKASLQLVREISMMHVGNPLMDMALVASQYAEDSLHLGNAMRAAADHVANNGSADQSVSEVSAAPRQCLLLRSGGIISVLDLEKGSEVVLSTDVESFWLSDSLPSQQQPWAPNTVTAMSAATHEGSTTSNANMKAPPGIEGDVEMPWWAYGPHGMQLWFPSSLADPLSPSRQLGAQHHDIELEFDPEVYPIGISLADTSIVGITQRITRASGASAPPPCLHPIPELQPVLPCLLRRLLQRNAFAEALTLARRHEHGPHFMRSLEWLLFTTLEMEPSFKSAKRPNPGLAVNDVAKDQHRQASVKALPGSESSTLLSQAVSPLLSSAAALVKHFPRYYPDVVVSVARKTDAQLWPPLFSAVGPPSALLEGLLQAGALSSAACFLLVIDRMEGMNVSHKQAIRLINLALMRGEYGLAGDLLRFIMPPSEHEGSISLPLSGIFEEGEAEGTSTLSEALDSTAQRGDTVTTKPYSTWLGWLLGNNSNLQQQEGGTELTMGMSQPTESMNAPMSVTKQPRASNGAPSSMTKTSSELTPATDARHVIAGHAWLMLEEGRLGALARLRSSMSFLPGDGLIQVMREASAPHHSSSEGGVGSNSFRSTTGSNPFRSTTGGCLESEWPLQSKSSCLVTAIDLAQGLVVAMEEFPVWSSEGIESEASSVYEVVRAVGAGGAELWVTALALLLGDMEEVRRFKAANEQVWVNFTALVQQQQELHFFRDIVEALNEYQSQMIGHATTKDGVSSTEMPFDDSQQLLLMGRMVPQSNNIAVSVKPSANMARHSEIEEGTPAPSAAAATPRSLLSGA
ncbi:hypothetical protein CEUSTIGMA_g5579.t1 [Chlamydomonas eustigma]|uniref:RIC1 C-terminal alpha solenoid region domain-containing protein n=1 Tax=Chlamydomonas eustigma TaxID=1157962 RepID=A0A250X4W9_9CHLO|nr:hypothetical protein CEUSTIGMA_g5579.t1 [Chlamydomonas eustigma]|eukprot:GAX78137.1 hypothetical protein CEUSTIGMA_g5579.t1 [Chlamydomonas eustigma]